MKSRVQKWGNSLAIRIPGTFAKETGLCRNAPVEISLEEGKISIAPLSEPGMTLKDLLAKINKKNLHHETDTGTAKGNEIW
jgi:antitoxin MazE